MGFHTMGATTTMGRPVNDGRSIDLGRYAYRTEEVRQRMDTSARQAPALLEFAPAVLANPVFAQLQGFSLEAEEAC